MGFQIVKPKTWNLNSFIANMAFVCNFKLVGYAGLLELVQLNINIAIKAWQWQPLQNYLNR